MRHSECEGMKTRWLLILSALVVALLVGGCGLWVYKAKQQYALNRQLIAALVNDDTKQALALVNAGADPNTRYEPTPAPTFKLLLNQMLHRSPASANNSSTAFMFVCSDVWYGEEHEVGVRIKIRLHAPENMALAYAMLAHGADCTLTTYQNQSALHCAVWTDRAKMVHLLLEHGAHVNQQDSDGYTALERAQQLERPDTVAMLQQGGK